METVIRLTAPEMNAVWLENIPIANGHDQDLPKKPPQQLELGVWKKEVPQTPTRRCHPLFSSYNKISPTDTCSTAGTVFDDLDSPFSRTNDYAPTIATSTSDEADDKDEKKRTQPPLKIRALCTTKDHDAELEPNTTLNSSLTTALHTLPPDFYITPRPIRIYSCLQCTLVNLHCSRTLPSCTRCMQKGKEKAELCLARRGKTVQEMRMGTQVGSCGSRGRYFYNVPVLLKLHGEDEGLWQGKVVEWNRLVGEWKEKMERENWVLPDIGGKRGGWKRGMYGGEGQGPGEGLGRITWRLVRLGEIVDGDLGTGGGEEVMGGVESQ